MTFHNTFGISDCTWAEYKFSELFRRESLSFHYQLSLCELVSIAGGLDCPSLVTLVQLLLCWCFYIIHWPVAIIAVCLSEFMIIFINFVPGCVKLCYG